MSLKNQAIQTALQGNWQEAIVLNKNLVKDDPQDIDALNRLALAYTITGKLKEARTAYQKVVNIDPLNSIALRNLKKLKETTAKEVAPINYRINNTFLEEPGKTKVIELVNIAQPNIIETLRTGQSLILSVKRLKIFVQDEKQYMGVLPDDIARRLIKIINAGGIYESFVKSANPHKVSVFIKEVKKPTKFKDQPSFLSNSDSLVVSKSARKAHDKETEEEQNEESSYPEE